MKSIHFIVTLFLLSLFNLGQSQIVYEGTHDDSFKTFQLDNGEVVYTKYNQAEQNVSVFTLDHKIWKEVQLPLPREHTLDEIKSISQYTFNTDNLVELVYSCVEYETRSELHSADSRYVDIHFTLNIINENGELILKVPDSVDMKILESNGLRKMLVYKHVGEGFRKAGQIAVYALPNRSESSK